MGKRVPIVELETPEPSKDMQMFFDRMSKAKLIDRDALDDMWVEQPQHYSDIADLLALEISLRDESKDDMNSLMAAVDMEVRESHSDDEKKPTETQIKNEVADDSRVKAAKIKLRGFERTIGRLSALRETFSMRRYALQDLTQLYLGSYYTNNSGGLKQARENTHESSRAAMQQERVKRK